LKCLDRHSAQHQKFEERVPEEVRLDEGTAGGDGIEAGDSLNKNGDRQ
jgi:hypothetical protein